MEQRKPTATGAEFVHLPAVGIDAFCELHRICRSSFYNLLKAGKAPRLTRIGRRVLITPEALAEWREAQTEPAPE